MMTSLTTLQNRQMMGENQTVDVVILRFLSDHCLILLILFAFELSFLFSHTLYRSISLSTTIIFALVGVIVCALAISLGFDGLLFDEIFSLHKKALDNALVRSVGSLITILFLRVYKTIYFSMGEGANSILRLILMASMYSAIYVGSHYDFFLLSSLLQISTILVFGYFSLRFYHFCSSSSRSSIANRALFFFGLFLWGLLLCIVLLFLAAFMGAHLAAEKGLTCEEYANDFYVDILFDHFPERALAYLVHLATEEGHVPSMVRLGLRYQQGIGVEKDAKLAVKYFDLAAQRGDRVAQYQLGRSFEYGFGVERDMKTAAFYYEQAAESGLTSAIYKVGVSYFRGIGVEKNVTLGMRLDFSCFVPTVY
jgi:hypothetical protein